MNQPNHEQRHRERLESLSAEIDNLEALVRPKDYATLSIHLKQIRRLIHSMKLNTYVDEPGGELLKAKEHLQRAMDGVENTYLATEISGADLAVAEAMVEAIKPRAPRDLEGERGDRKVKEREELADMEAAE